MTRPGWMAEAALAATLPEGVAVVMSDPMDFPLLTLRPDVQVVTPAGTLLLRPGNDGVAVLRTAAADLPDPSRPVLAAGPTAAAAKALARSCLGRAPDGCFDGSDPAAQTGIGRSWMEGLAAGLDLDPLALLHRIASAGCGIVGIDVTTEGDALLWLDPLCCVRPATMAEACRSAVDRDVSGVPLSLPRGGRGTVRLVFRGSAPRFPSGGEGVSRIDDRTLEIRPAGAGGMLPTVPIRGARCRIDRVGLVLPYPGDPAAAEFDDPLDVYADPAFRDAG